MDFLWQGMFTASPKTALQESSQFDFSLIFSPHLCSRTNLTLSQITELNTAVAMGTIAQTAVCWTIFNLSLVYSF